MARARKTVARFLERIVFEAIILHEQANRGRTVIEKVEANCDVQRKRPWSFVLRLTLEGQNRSYRFPDSSHSNGTKLPTADPHGGRCGIRELEAPGYPLISRRRSHSCCTWLLSPDVTVVNAWIRSFHRVLPLQN